MTVLGLMPLMAACEMAHSEIFSTNVALDTQPGPPPRIGLDAFTSLAELPVLKRGVRAGGRSSAASSAWTRVSDAMDPNDDYGNYVRVDANERVLLDVTGAGAIYRFWHTDDAMDAWADGGSIAYGSPITYHFYFDGEDQPSLELDAQDLWRGRIEGFPAPLALDANASSGGAVLIRPITFAKGIKVTATGSDYPEHDYYSIGYSLYADVTAVATFRGDEDPSAARAVVSRAGQNPIAADPSDVNEAHTLDLPGGASVTLDPIVGPALITELVVTVPNMRRETYPVTSEDGRSTKTASRFELAIAEDNTSVRLERRLADDHPQAADVYVDGALAGRWTTEGLGDAFIPTRKANAWRDASFEVPSELTAHKSRIEVRIDVAGASEEPADWNEYRYSVWSRRGEAEEQTDALDVGDRESETAHAYAIEAETWTGTSSFRPLQPVVIEGDNDGRALEKVRLQIFWDEDDKPAVDAPLPELFGTGAGYLARVQSLMLGHDGGRFYCYFPMPFAKSARVALVSEAGTPDLHDVQVSIRRRPFMVDFADVGYFHAEHRSAAETTVGRDYDILTVSGQGHYVGVNLIVPALDYSIDGDEHVFVDGLRTPSISGTGTEDFVNGGWHFSRGPFTAALSGTPERGPTLHPISMYRLQVSDLVPFRTSLRVAIEHDGLNSNRVPYASVAYYYLKGGEGMTETDAFEPAGADAAAHSFSTTGEARSSVVTARFASDTSVDETRTGVVNAETSQFEIAIAPDNSGVVLRRVFDQSLLDQRADVYVGGELAGTWLAAGSDDVFRWREDEFWIPAAFTRDRTSLDVRLEVRSERWNAFQYRVFSLRTH